MRRLYKSRKHKVIDGVCGGIAEYLDLDPVLIRVFAVLFFFTGGAALIAYIIGMIIIPQPPPEETQAGDAASAQGTATAPHGPTEDHTRNGSLIAGVLLILFGIYFLLRNIPFFQQFYWRFWNLSWDFFWPAVLIALGLLVIFRGFRK
ncbi:MAG TPA: PspC domain-containing protein [Acidobacteriota bacterium]|nr:PspC domain-containing protein [Acidobacteriota bacterium]